MQLIKLNPRYSVLIIGAGNMGCLNDAPGSGNEHKIISYTNALLTNGHFDVYIKDVIYEKVKDAIRIWDNEILPYDPKKYYDIIIIATPDNYHYGVLWDIKEKFYPKLVICEKPLCGVLRDAEKIVSIYSKLRIPILLDYTRRFIPYWQDIKKYVEQGKYGNFQGYSINYNRGTKHTASHILDFINWIFPDIEFNLSKINNLGDRVNYRIFDMKFFMENFCIQETRIGEQPVSSIYDYHTKYVIDNAYNFLENDEALKCDMYDGFKVLKQIEEWNLS